MPTREDVLAIRSIEEAFDLHTMTVMPRELALVRIAADEGLLEIRGHAVHAADDEGIIDQYGTRQVGINFERTLSDWRRIRVKVSWDGCHYTVTVHTI